MSNVVSTILSDIDTSADGLTYTVDTSVLPGAGYTLSNGGTFVNSFAFAEPTKEFKAGTITIKGEGSEEAEFDAAFINDLKILLEVINDLPDEHPLGELKHDMRMRRAFKRLGG